MSQPIAIEVYTAEQLQKLPEILSETLKVINLAFLRMWAAGFEAPRFDSTDQLLDMLVPGGLCAVCRLDKRIVASLSIIPWQPDGAVYSALEQERPADFRLLGQGLSYEVRAAVTLDTPASRGKGLIQHCIEELVLRLRERHSGNSCCLLWAGMAEDQNGAYWRRRGFEQIGPAEIKPKGLWGSVRDFEYVTLVKNVSLCG
jgi:hypothetical protein